jgi:hypothetical protein
MANIPDEEIQRDAVRSQFVKYAKRSGAKMQKQPQSKRAKTDLFRRGRRLPGSAYSRKG